jgi:hypothetical protein
MNKNHHNNKHNNDNEIDNCNNNNTNNAINNNTDAIENNHMNESKLKAIWQAIPTRTRIILILGTVQYRTEQYIHYKQFRSRDTVKNKQSTSRRLGHGQDSERESKSKNCVQ